MDLESSASLLTRYQVRLLPTTTTTKRVQAPSAADFKIYNDHLRRARADHSRQGQCEWSGAKLKRLAKEAAETNHQPWKIRGHRDATVVLRRGCGFRGMDHLAKFRGKRGAVHQVSGANLEDPWPAEAKNREWWRLTSKEEPAHDNESAREEGVTLFGAGGPGETQNDDGEMEEEDPIPPQPLGYPEGAQGEGGGGSRSVAQPLATGRLAGEGEGIMVVHSAGFDDLEVFRARREAEEVSEGELW